MRTSFFAPLRDWARRTSTSMGELHLLPAVREDPRPQGGLVYRLRHWPELPDAMHTANVLQTLSVMSCRPVNRAWILRHSRLKPPALDGLLNTLSTRGDLEVVDTSMYRAPRH